MTAEALRTIQAHYDHGESGRLGSRAFRVVAHGGFEMCLPADAFADWLAENLHVSLTEAEICDRLPPLPYAGLEWAL
jgi:hypothetical protein